MSVVIRAHSRKFEIFFAGADCVSQFSRLPSGSTTSIPHHLPLPHKRSRYHQASLISLFLYFFISHVVSTAIPCPSTITLFKTGDANTSPTRHNQVVARGDPTICERRCYTN